MQKKKKDLHWDFINLTFGTRLRSNLDVQQDGYYTK